MKLRVAVAMVVVGGCYASTDKLRTRAAFDLNCNQSALQLTELEAGNALNGGTGAVYGVTGCGHRATYFKDLSGGWRMNSSEGQVAPVASAQ